jgi:hypothetical protein
MRGKKALRFKLILKIETRKCSLTLSKKLIFIKSIINLICNPELAIDCNLKIKWKFFIGTQLYDISPNTQLTWSFELYNYFIALILCSITVCSLCVFRAILPQLWSSATFNCYILSSKSAFIEESQFVSRNWSQDDWSYFWSNLSPPCVFCNPEVIDLNLNYKSFLQPGTLVT